MVHMARWAMAKATLRKLYSDKEQNVGSFHPARAAKQHLLCLLLVNYSTNWYILLHHYVYAVLLESYDF